MEMTSLARHHSQNHPLTSTHTSPLAGQNQVQLLVNHPINNQDEQITAPHQYITITEEEGQAEEEAEVDVEEAEGEVEEAGEEEENANNLTPYALSAVLSISTGAVVFGLKQGKHAPLLSIENPFAVLSVVSAGLAYGTYCIISWMNDRSGYKKLAAIYYIACTLAFISALWMLFTASKNA